MAAEIGVGYGSERAADRRGRSMGPRRSWASPQPFVRRDTPFNGPAAVAGSWRQMVWGHRWRAVVSDAVGVLLVAIPVLLADYGSSLDTAGLLVVATVGFAVLVCLLHGYHSDVLGKLTAEIQVLVKSGATVVVLLILASFVTKAQISRLVVFAVVPVGVLFAIAGRAVLHQSLRRSRAAGLAMKRTMVVGDEAAVAGVVRDLRRDFRHGYAVVGVCLPSVRPNADVEGSPVVGALSDIPQAVVDRAIDVVVAAGTYFSGNGMRRLSWALDRAGAQLIVAPDLVEVNAPRLAVRPTAGLSFLEVEVGASRRKQVGKTLLDRGLGALLLLAAAPVILGAGLAIRLTSPGPAFYRQTRIGVDGREFTMWKLRTMQTDADARRSELVAAHAGGGVLFKLRDDPRVTPVGRILRKFSLDELPQLFNVVTGDMSLVGPRPPLAEEVAVYEDAVQRRLRVRPGLTGLWQISGRSDLTWDESVRLDLRYVDNWSVTMDLLILWKTFRAVLRPSGAY